MPQYVDITPHVSLFAKAGQAGHSIAEAVSELVDNSIDARFEGEPLHVNILYDVRGGWIEVSDDGRGMSRRELAGALVMARSSKGADKIGRFGLGLKTACTSLGARFRVVTCRRDHHFEAVAEYDEATFMAAGEWKLPIRRKKKQRLTGTTIVIESDRVYNGLSQSLIRNLGWTFRHFIADGVLELRVNGEVVGAPRHQIDTDSVLPLYGTVAGREVRGWAGLLLVSSQRGWYGFDLIRQRRVIRRHEKLGFQAHPQNARVCGELHLDAFETNNLKTDFIRETHEWRQLEAWLSASIEPILAASRALAHSGSFDRRLKDLIALEREKILAALGDETLNVVLEIKGLRRSAGSHSESVMVVIGPFHVEHAFVEDQNAPFMRYQRVSRAGESDLIRVQTNLGFGHLGGDIAGWACHNIAEALTLELGVGEGYVEMKSRIWTATRTQPGLTKALRRAVRAKEKESGARDSETVLHLD